MTNIELAKPSNFPQAQFSLSVVEAPENQRLLCSAKSGHFDYAQ